MLCTGVATVNAKYGTRTAVMLGDFLFAQSSWFLANLNNLEVRFHSPLPMRSYSMAAHCHLSLVRCIQAHAVLQGLTLVHRQVHA